jgi:hypothetical protein
MSKATIARSRARGEQPVKSGIHRAAKRIGLEPAEVQGDELDRTDEELDVLRNVAELAEKIFESGEEIGNAAQSVTGILREALRSVRADIELISDSNGTGSSVGFWPFRRAEFRIDLALALAEYRQEFPRADSDDGGAP